MSFASSGGEKADFRAAPEADADPDSMRLCEDEDGVLKLVSRSKEGKRAKLQADDSVVRRGVIRFLVVVVDCSEIMNSRDMRPNRLTVVVSIVNTLLQDFFDQNPISQVALVQLRDGRAERITELSGNARHHKHKLEEKVEAGNFGGKGPASLRHGLEEALRLLEVQASYGTREVLVVYGALNSLDRGDIYETVGKLKAGGVRVSIVGMAAEVFLCQNVAAETGGRYTVATSAMGLKEAVLSHTNPPPILEKTTAGGAKVARAPATGMWVGFPARVQGVLSGWQCPRCRSLHADLPVDCGLCGLKLLASAHLARSYHHLFPVAQFEEEEGGGWEAGVEEGAAGGVGGAREAWACFGCGVSGKERRHTCTRCEKAFCELCDGFIHETLHVCPGCDVGGGEESGVSCTV